MFEVILPLPPSANNLFVNLKRGGRAKSAEYKQWLGIAKSALTVAYHNAGRPKFEDKARMRLVALVGVNYRRDLSNCIKPVEDALCAFLPVPDDRYNDHVELIRDPSLEGFVRVRLEPVK